MDRDFSLVVRREIFVWKMGFVDGGGQLRGILRGVSDFFYLFKLCLDGDADLCFSLWYVFVLMIIRSLKSDR